ncbi:MAG: universal stress protein [Chloroflexota bacterium]|nr:universal stress protein [Chloroflexota bacterium]
MFSNNREVTRPRKVLVLVNGSEADREAIRLSCKLSKKTACKIYAAYVIQVDRSLPLDAEVESEVDKAEKILDQAERIADEYDCSIETDLLQAREIGPAIVDEAIERGVDLITLGLSYKKKFGEFSLGNVLPYILKNAPCRVLICREPMPKEEI